MKTVERGRRGENLAAAALATHSYEVVDRNWHCPAGELDLVAREADAWVFVEVKLRQGESFGSPEDAITYTKQERLLKCAQLYVAGHDLADVFWRIDVVAIELARSGRVERLTLYRDAIRADDCP